MAKENIKEFVKRNLSIFLEEEGIELYQVEFVKEGKDRFLRVKIDKMPTEKEEYIGSDDCEKVSKYLSEILDREDPIEGSYYLEVSSPGLDRALLTEKDYIRFANREVVISLYQPFQGSKKYEGILLKLEEGRIFIRRQGDEEIVVIPFDIVANTKLKVVF